MQNKNFHIINIMLASVNGKIAFHTNESTTERNNNHFTCPDDFEHMRSLVAQCNVVFCGARTIETERGAFRVSDLRSSKHEPEWIIFTRSGELSFKSPFWTQEGIPKSLFFVSSFNMNEAPVFKIEEKEFNFCKITCYLGNINGLILYLKNKNYTKVALLGGGKLNAAFWKNHLVDELYLTVSPFIIGGENIPELLQLKENFINRKLILKNCESKGNFVFLDYIVNREVEQN